MSNILSIIITNANENVYIYKCVYSHKDSLLIKVTYEDIVKGIILFFNFNSIRNSGSICCPAGTRLNQLERKISIFHYLSIAFSINFIQANFNNLYFLLAIVRSLLPFSLLISNMEIIDILCMNNLSVNCLTKHSLDNSALLTSIINQTDVDIYVLSNTLYT